MLKGARVLSVTRLKNSLESQCQYLTIPRLRYFDAAWNGLAISKVNDTAARQGP